LVVKPFDPTSNEAIAPFADRMGTDAKPGGHGGVAGLALARQYDFRSQRQCRRQRARPCYRHKLHPFVAGNHERRVPASGSHRVSPSLRIPEPHAIIMLETSGTEHCLERAIQNSTASSSASFIGESGNRASASLAIAP